MKIKILVLITIIFSSCSVDDVLNDNIDIYAAGTFNESACYWKNNELTLLDNNGYSSTYATDIFVTNDNTYILGSATIDEEINPDEIKPYLFWENEVVSNLNVELSEPGVEIYRIDDFYVDDENVYFVGITETLSLVSQYSLAYWKNGIKTILDENIERDNTSYIEVINDNAYVFYSDNFSNGVQGIYANNSFTQVNSNYGFIKMKSNENEIYIYGRLLDSSDGFYYNFNTGIETTTPYEVEVLDFDQNNVYTLAFSDLSYYKEIFKNDKLYYQVDVDHIINDFKIYNDNLYTIEDIFFGPQILYINGSPLITLENASTSTDNFINAIYIYDK